MYRGPTRTYDSVFHAENRGCSETSIRPTHLIFATPIHPGTRTRTGKPWSIGRVCPFIAYTRSVSSASAFAIGIGRRTFNSSRPSGITSWAERRSPARSSTSRRGTPVHSATPIAPNFHCPPCALFPYDASKKLRPFPAHSMNRMTDTDGRPRISS